MKKIVVAALAIIALSGSSAFACTQQELQAKAMAFSAKLQDLAKKDPQKASAWSQQYAAKMGAAPTNVDEACKFYDDLTATIPG